ncbi:pyrroline-5-carboxylate reductase [Maricaulis sp. CAU 1757]
MTKALKIALVGAGNMGGALAKGWLSAKRGGIKADNLVLIDPAPGELAQELIEAHGLTCLPEAGAGDLDGVDMLVLAAKPAVFENLAESLAPLLPAKAGILSVMAGVTLSRLALAFGDRPMVRAMPNIAAGVGAGVSVCVANPAGEELDKLTNRLLKGSGSVEWVRDERLIGAVTAVSGSGPAYVFLLAEALAGAGFAEGLPRDLAEKLARDTIIGAGALLAQSDKTPQELRRAVTSPNGTTQAAVDILMGGGGGLPELIRQAVAAAERRSRQIGADKRGR